MSLSMPTTSSPSEAKCRTASEPIRPAEPVTRATLTSEDSLGSGSGREPLGSIPAQKSPKCDGNSERDPPHRRVSLLLPVGKGGVEPPRPFGHTDMNRARLPFRHFPGTAGLRDPSSAERLERHYAALGATEE